MATSRSGVNAFSNGSNLRLAGGRFAVYRGDRVSKCRLMIGRRNCYENRGLSPFDLKRGQRLSFPHELRPLHRMIDCVGSRPPQGLQVCPSIRDIAERVRSLNDGNIKKGSTYFALKTIRAIPVNLLYLNHLFKIFAR